MRLALVGLCLAGLASTAALAAQPRAMTDEEARAAYCGGVLEAKAAEISKLGAPPEPEMREAWQRLRRATLEARLHVMASLTPHADELDSAALSAAMTEGAKDNEAAHAMLAQCVASGDADKACMEKALKDATVRRVQVCTLLASPSPAPAAP